MAVVKKRFLWAVDGITAVAMMPGDHSEFGSSTHGLITEGYISEDVAPETESEVVAQADVTLDDTAHDDVVMPTPAVQPRRRTRK